MLEDIPGLGQQKVKVFFRHSPLVFLIPARTQERVSKASRLTAGGLQSERGRDRHGRRSEGSAVGRVGRVSEGVARRVARRVADKASKSYGVIAYRGQSSAIDTF